MKIILMPKRSAVASGRMKLGAGTRTMEVLMKEIAVWAKNMEIIEIIGLPGVVYTLRVTTH